MTKMIRALAVLFSLAPCLHRKRNRAVLIKDRVRAAQILIAFMDIGFLAACGGSSSSIDELNNVNFSIDRATISGASDIVATVTANGVADTDVSDESFSIPLNLDGIDLNDDFGDGSTVTNTITLEATGVTSDTTVISFVINP